MKNKPKMWLVLLLILVGAYLLGLALKYDNMFLFQGLLNWGLWLGIIMLLIRPFVWIRYRDNSGKNSKRPIRLFCLAAFILLIEILLLLSPRIGWFASLEWNWQGKLFSLAVALLFITLWSGLSWKDMGLTAPRQGSWLRVLIILAGTGLLSVLSSSETTMTKGLETLLFQATMPGLEEELIYRGILWALIAQVLPGTRTLWGAKVGWNLIITTLLFAFIHGITFDDQLSVNIDLAALIFTGIAGFIIGWVRAYSGSILPAIVLHNGINLLAALVPWLL